MQKFFTSFAFFTLAICLAQPNALFNDNGAKTPSPISADASIANSILTVENSTNSTTGAVIPGLFNSDNSSDSFVERAEKRWKDLMKQPYVHSIVLPAMIGVLFAILTMIIVCCIRSCVRSHVRKKRRLRIRNLADELKTDRSMLLADSSDDEF